MVPLYKKKGKGLDPLKTAPLYHIPPPPYLPEQPKPTHPNHKNEIIKLPERFFILSPLPTTDNNPIQVQYN